jgi:hypothetical protein
LSVPPRSASTAAPPGQLPLGRWAWFAFAVTVCTVFFTDANRFLPPVREKYPDSIGIGASDFIPTFNAAWALLDGVNPYHSDPAKYPDPYAVSRGGPEHFSYLYPPTHALVYVPFAKLAGRSFVVAARMHFYFSLIVLVLLCAAWADILQAIMPLAPELRLTSGLLAMYILGLNAGNQLGLERGQSDLLSAAAVWWSVALFCRGRYGGAAFLAVASALLKGYGAPFAAGLLLLGLTRARRRATLMGAGLALLILLAPVARYLPDAAHALPLRLKMFWWTWNNQSVYALGFLLQPSAAGWLRWVAIGFGSVVAVLSFLRFASLDTAYARDADAELAQARALAASNYTTAALAFILACSRNSIAYDAVLVLPGALLIALSQVRLTRPGSFASAAAGSWLALVMFALCAFSLPRLIGRLVPTELPLHAVGILSLSLLIALVSVRARIWSS